MQEKINTIRLAFRLPMYLCVVLLVANLNAVVDLFQHPEIPYFDEEHILVGTIAGAVTLVLVVLLELYLRSLEKAMGKIRFLEYFLSICANCNRVRIPGCDPLNKESWRPIDQYIEQNTNTRFSHGICPVCIEKLYPGASQDILHRPDCL